jgi:acyl-CoA hydrolase
MRVETKNPLTGQINHTNSCYFTMIAKDENGNKKSVPGLIIENEVQLRRFYEGMYLKQLAMEKRKILKSDFSHISLDELRQNCSKEKCSILI